MDYLERIRQKKAADDDARRERERRRRRILTTQQAASQEAQKARDEDALLAILVRASAAETRLAEEYAMRRRVKEEIRLRREARTRMYQERRERDADEAMMRQAEEARRLHEAQLAERALVQQRDAELRAARSVPPPRVPTPPPTEEMLASADAEAIIRGEGEWAPAHPESQLGLVLRDLARAVRPPPPAPPAPKVPVATCAVLVCSTAAGQIASELAQRIADARFLQLFRAGDCVQEAVKRAQSDPSATEGLAALGRRADEALRAGAAVPDDVLVDIVTALLAERDRAAGPGGWVLDATLSEPAVQRLETALSGYVAPPPPPPDPRRKPKAAVAPVPAETTPPPVSGLTTVLRVQQADEPALATWDAWFARFAPPLLTVLAAAGTESDALLQAALAAVDAGAQAKKDRDDRAAAAAAAAAEAASQQEAAEQAAARAAAAEKQAAAQAAATAAAAAAAAPPAKGAGKARAPSPVPAPVPAAPEPTLDELAAAELEARREAERRQQEKRRELGQHIMARWETVQTAYVDELRSFADRLRRVRRSVLTYLEHTRREFRVFLDKPDSRQDQVSKFILRFNNDQEMPPSLRPTAEGKAELHLRTDELRDALWGDADARRDAAIAERKALAESGWIKQTVATLQALHVRLVQAETDRHQAARQALVDAAAWREDKPLPMPAIERLDVSAAPEPTASAAGGKPGAKPAAPAAAKPAGKPVPGGKPGAAPAADEPAPDPVATAVARARSLLTPAGSEAAAALSAELAAEEAVFASRLERIEARAKAAVESVQARGDELFAELDAALAARFVSEVDAVRSLTAAIKTAIEAGQKLPNELRLAPGCAVLDDGVLAFEPPAPPPPAPPREPRHRDRFTVEQLRQLHAVLQAAAPDHVMPVLALGLLLVRVAAQSAETRAVPAGFAALSQDALLDLARRYDTGAGYADTRRLLLELAFDAAPPVDALAAACTALGEVASRETAAAYGWWFATATAAAPAPDVFDRGAALRDLLLDVFTVPGATPDAPAAVAVGDMLLFLCAAAAPDEGLQRAYRMLGGNLTVEQTFRVLHHGAPGAAGSILPYDPAHDPASLARLQAVYGSAERMSLEDIRQSVDGAAAVASARALYVRRM